MSPESTGREVETSLFASWNRQESPLSALVADPKDAQGIARAYFEQRFTQQEVADHLGVRYSTISRRVGAMSPQRHRNMMRDYKTWRRVGLPSPVYAIRVAL